MNKEKYIPMAEKLQLLEKAIAENNLTEAIEIITLLRSDMKYLDSRIQMFEDSIRRHKHSFENMLSHLSDIDKQIFYINNAMKGGDES